MNNRRAPPLEDRAAASCTDNVGYVGSIGNNGSDRSAGNPGVNGLDRILYTIRRVVGNVAFPSFFLHSFASLAFQVSAIRSTLQVIDS